MKITSVFGLFLILVLLSNKISARERHALVIGIGEYADSRWGRINADLDVDYVVETLSENGFSNIKILKNKDASKQAILMAFDSLKNNCHQGDFVYIQFSGHGQQITDIDGDERDGYDEAWIPYDAQPYYCDSYRGENHLVDDEINHLLSCIREKVGAIGRILIVVDACFSGDTTRGTDVGVSRGFSRKFIIPIKKPAPIPELEENWITLCACKPYQISWEMTNPQVGKLTWCLYELRGQLRELSNEQLRASISRLMLLNPGPVEQTPYLTGGVRGESIRDLFLE